MDGRAALPEVRAEGHQRADEAGRGGGRSEGHPVWVPGILEPGAWRHAVVRFERVRDRGGAAGEGGAAQAEDRGGAHIGEVQRGRKPLDEDAGAPRDGARQGGAENYRGGETAPGVWGAGGGAACCRAHRRGGAAADLQLSALLQRPDCPDRGLLRLHRGDAGRGGTDAVWDLEDWSEDRAEGIRLIF